MPPSHICNGVLPFVLPFSLLVLLATADPCPKACDPHNNKCDVTAPTCIFPDPEVSGPRGACACRPGYKATGYGNDDITVHWRLPIESHEHRVWVAEGVKCDSVCDVSTGVESCREVQLIGGQCVGAGYKASNQSIPMAGAGFGNYSRSLSVTHTETSSDAYAQSTYPSDAPTDSYDEPESPSATLSDPYREVPVETGTPSDASDESDPYFAADLGDQDEATFDVEFAVSNENELHPTGATASGELDDYDAVLAPVLDNSVKSLAATETASSGTVAVGNEDELYPTSATASDELDDFDAVPAPVLDNTVKSSAATKTLSSGTDEMLLEDSDESANDEALVVPSQSDMPIVQVRAAVRTNWAQIAEQRGLQSYKSKWSGYVQSLTKVVNNVDLRRQQKLCPAIIGSVVDTCKRGVRTQVANCKNLIKDSIAKCKNDARSSVDKCKKSKKNYDWPGKWECERRGILNVPKCEIDRINVPLCEVDRLTAGCCEATRPQAKAMCAAGFSTAEVQKQIDSVQATCSVATALAKAAMKSYLSGQVIGFIVQLESVKAIGDTVQIIRKAEQKRAQFDRWAKGLTAAAEGRTADAQKNLVALAHRISPAVSDTIAWAEAAQAAVNKDVDAFLAKAAAAAGELEMVKVAKDSIAVLGPVANDLAAIQAAAEDCARVSVSITPPEFPGWKGVKSEDDVAAAVAAYEKTFTKALHDAAKCQAVVTRVGRLLKL